MITIPLTKPEARLCRDAAKLAKAAIFPAEGVTTLPRGDWCDLAQWLGWLACDMEIERDLDDRKAAERLSLRIEREIAQAVEACDECGADHPLVEYEPGAWLCSECAEKAAQADAEDVPGGCLF